MPSDSHTSASIQILMKEYERVCADIRVIETMNDKVVGFGLTIIGTGFAYGLHQHLNEVFVFLPVAFFAVFLYATLQYHNMFWFGGYKRAIEDRINSLSGERVLAWEALVDSQRGRVNVINFGLVAIYLTLLTASTAFSIFKIFSWQGLSVGMPFSAFILALAVLLIFAVRRMFGAYDQSYRLSSKAFATPVSAEGDEQAEQSNSSDQPL